METNQSLKRRTVQDAMKRALFFIMDSTAILPLLALPLLFSKEYLIFLAVYMFCMSLLVLTDRSPKEFCIHVLSKFNRGNTHPLNRKYMWKPTNRV